MIPPYITHKKLRLNLRLKTIGIFTMFHFPSNLHCVKSVQIRSFFWSEYRKIQTRKTPYLDTFHAVLGTVKCFDMAILETLIFSMIILTSSKSISKFQYFGNVFFLNFQSFTKKTLNLK